jgi:hypothetical protein
VQQTCLRRLVVGGLSSVVYVGDLEQAIYGFAHADIETLRDLMRATTVNELGLTENWRSSQAICDVAYRFSGRTEPDRAVGEFADEPVRPEVIVYPDGNETDAVATFTGRLDALGIPHHEALVLCRWTATTDRLSGAAEVALTGGLRVIVEAVAEARSDCPMRRETVGRLEQFLLSFIEPEVDFESLDSEARHDVRASAIRIIDSVEDFGIDVKTWAARARDVVTDVVESLAGSAPKVGNRIRAPGGAGDRSVVEIVGAEPLSPAVSTIHSAKGESHLATLLIAVDRDRRGNANWTTWLGGEDPEEARVAYVALTRAQRYSALALPESCPAEVLEEFLNRGFRHLDRV